MNDSIKLKVHKRRNIEVVFRDETVSYEFVIMNM